MKCKLLKSSLIIAGVLAGQSAFATQAGDYLARARVINVAPSVDSQEITLIGGGAFPAAGSQIDAESQPTIDVDFTYFVTNNFGIELLLDTTSLHEINGAGAIGSAGKLGEVRALPPALIAQYHFTPGKRIRPYVGAGINYTFFLNEETTPTLDSVVPGSTSGLEVDDTFALVAQAGVDIDIDNDWYFNVDLKYIALDTTATISSDGVAAATVDFELNPVVFGAGLGMRF